VPIAAADGTFRHRNPSVHCAARRFAPSSGRIQAALPDPAAPDGSVAVPDCPMWATLYASLPSLGQARLTDSISPSLPEGLPAESALKRSPLLRAGDAPPALFLTRRRPTVNIYRYVLHVVISKPRHSALLALNKYI
jgi:hypothetical protein